MPVFHMLPELIIEFCNAKPVLLIIPFPVGKRKLIFNQVEYFQYNHARLSVFHMLQEVNIVHCSNEQQKMEFQIVSPIFFFFKCETGNRISIWQCNPIKIASHSYIFRADHCKVCYLFKQIVLTITSAKLVFFFMFQM